MYCLSIESSNILYIQVGINNEFKLAFCFCAFEKVEREINFNEVGKAQHVKWFYFKNYSDVIAVFILRYMETKNENVFWLDMPCIYLFHGIKVCPYSRGIPTNFPNYEESVYIRFVFYLFLGNFLITLPRFLFLYFITYLETSKKNKAYFVQLSSWFSKLFTPSAWVSNRPIRLQTYAYLMIGGRSCFKFIT